MSIDLRASRTLRSYQNKVSILTCTPRTQDIHTFIPRSLQRGLLLLLPLLERNIVLVQLLLILLGSLQSQFSSRPSLG